MRTPGRGVPHVHTNSVDYRPLAHFRPSPIGAITITDGGVGRSVGVPVCSAVGAALGAAVGVVVGAALGADVGASVGAAVGRVVAATVVAAAVVSAAVEAVVAALVVAAVVVEMGGSVLVLLGVAAVAEGRRVVGILVCAGDWPGLDGLGVGLSVGTCDTQDDTKGDTNYTCLTMDL